jgi:hypothetical protein
MIKQFPSINFILNTIDDIAAFGLLIIGHLDLSLMGGTFSSIFCLHIILHAKSVFGSSTVKWVIAKLPRPSSSFLMMYFPSITLRVCRLALRGNVFYIAFGLIDNTYLMYH